MLIMKRFEQQPEYGPPRIEVIEVHAECGFALTGSGNIVDDFETGAEW